MGSFFQTIFVAIGIIVILLRGKKVDDEHQAHMDEFYRRHDNWSAKINKGPLNGYDFYEKISKETAFRDKLFDECNAIFDSIPEMNSIKLFRPLHYNTWSVMKMIYDARTGDIPNMWVRGYIRIQEFTDAFQRTPPTAGCQVFMEWYQEELRKNGYTDATIVPITRNGDTIGWRFTDGVTTLDELKRELLADD